MVVVAETLVTSGRIVDERCGSDAGCGARWICEDDRCQKGWRLSRECPDGLRCTNRVCVPPSANGVYDIRSNVREIGPEGLSWVRGGAYDCIDSQSLHLYDYSQSFSGETASNVGFRCCKDGLR